MKNDKRSYMSKMDNITNIHIGLEKAEVQGIQSYIERLMANSSSDNFEDFLLEGKAALTFRKAGFCVTLQEAPDLALKLNGEQLYAEVKHFRLKEQDLIDDVKMREPGDRLVLYGDTVPLEGKPAWEQVYGVAKKKIDQYKEHSPNILVIENSSTAIEDPEINTARNKINEDVRSGKCPGLAKLNGILLTSDWNNISQQWRNVFFYRTCNPAVSLSLKLSDLLDEIRLG